MIYALYNKPRGRGHLRHWAGFSFNTKSQDSVENFMLSIGVGADQYFLMEKESFKISTEYPYHLLLSGGTRDLWVMDQEVIVKDTKLGHRFTIIYEAEE